ncbi:hypothetical protein HBI25_109770 [Parastagonospora nodorum]|nr:hypothetical protein HBH49_221350 [Parastagonospora nodorum]KAH4098784.1 hypothetical protein HBH46_153490 [Parastagonospora nodorum]KAH4117121.1 hypothetical protein HBH47_159820 [Parastagonospora nodorum]KAH5035573.1 hypothetical protein HBI74_065780 [Parastagonospora nodorum]KAH5084705.1 hypothetical protein HBH95_029170 [Parastagonospora nodorum]
MTATSSSSTPTTVRARAESEERMSFVLYVQTSTTLSTSLSFILYPPPTSFTTLKPSNSTNSTPGSTLTPTPLNSTTSPQPTTVPEGKPKPKETWTLNIESGSKGINIGTWSLDETYYGLRNGLRERCGDPVLPPITPRKKAKQAAPAPAPTKQWGSNTCSSEVSLFNREYSTSGGEQFWAEKVVHVRIASSFIPASYGLNLQNIFIEQVVDIYRLAVVDGKNCLQFDSKTTSCPACIALMCTQKMPGKDLGVGVNKKTRIRRWCNVPDYVRVALTDAGGKEQAHMKVEVQFVCPKEKDQLFPKGCIKDMGRFDCVAVMGAVSGEARGNGTRGAMLKKATDGKDVDVVADCPDKEVTGTCPNKECMYKIGGCFRGLLKNY